MATSALTVPAQALVNDVIRVERPAAALPQTAHAAIFTVTGRVVIRQIVGIITFAIGAIANATKLVVNPDGVGADTDICATVELNAALVDGILTITGTFANAMVLTANIPLAGKQATEIICPPGAIELNCAGSDGGTGRIKWECVYWPLEDGASVVAA
jgi:hypothetical protein